MIHTLKSTLIASGASAAAGAALAIWLTHMFVVAVKDAEIFVIRAEVAEMRADAADAVVKQKEKNTIIRGLRDEQAALNDRLALAREMFELSQQQEATDARIEYVTSDANATDCGFSVAGVCAWNQAAAIAGGPGMREAANASCAVDGDGSIAARNAEIIAAAETNLQRYATALGLIQGLRDHIRTECMP